jgi:hypothetical protein
MTIGESGNREKRRSVTGDGVRGVFDGGKAKKRGKRGGEQLVFQL